MAEKKDLVLENIQKALRHSAKLSAENLTKYLMTDGKILPGIREGGQIITETELAALPELDALCYRLRFVNQCAGTLRQQMTA